MRSGWARLGRKRKAKSASNQLEEVNVSLDQESGRVGCVRKNRGPQSKLHVASVSALIAHGTVLLQPARTATGRKAAVMLENNSMQSPRHT
jgi:hypothetical protein